ncbi:hypothetical protein MTBLM1_30031 [Rhodospirillaceae bacterium LM-1]|nr:hypothetical protein MTBLM1_30031 [Rhodospirillaceae bacterium LM-1]
MGGFNSVTEGLSSGNGTTASGVPMGDPASSENSVASSPSSFSLSSSDSNWTSQALAPAIAMTQPMPEQQDFRLQTIEPNNDAGWNPNQAALEKASHNLLDNKTSGFGSYQLAEADTSERKVNPIVSKLAREHPENPVSLRGSLLGAPEFAQQPIKPPNPFAQRDELPKLPKIDWTVYDNHRIEGKTRISHDDWARVINLTKDFGGIIPAMVRTIQDYGDGGRGNVADVIGRVAQTNPDHARYFQRELSTALGGETIPARMARMVGEPVDNSEAPGLLGPSKPAQYDFEQMRKSYWQSVEAYKAESAQKQLLASQQEQTASDAPKQRQDAEVYPPATEQPRPSPERNDLFGQIEKLKPEHRATLETLEKIRDRGKALGRDHSADLLDHYLNGNGEPVTLDKDWVRQHPPVKEGEAKSQKHFEDWLVGQGPGDRKLGKIWDHLPEGEGSVTIKGMQWDGAVDNPSWRKLDDKSNTLGGLTVKGEGDIKLERKGNEVIVTGTVNQRARDDYDFKKEGRNGEWLPQGVLGGDFTMTRQQITDMERAGGAKAFEIQTDPWSKNLEGRLKLDDRGNIVSSQFVWKEVTSSGRVQR